MELGGGKDENRHLANRASQQPLHRQGGTMTPQQIKELAGHRPVPPWVMKLVGEAIAVEREACAKLIEPNEEHRRDASWGYLGGDEGVELLDGAAAKIRARGQE